MDPNANLRDQELLIIDIEINPNDLTNVEIRDRRHELAELRQALTGWLASGGFEPDWTKAPNAAKHYGKAQHVTKRSLLIGERVRIHPASDWFMRGVTYGVITSKRLRGEVVIHNVRPDTPGVYAPAQLRMKLTRDYLIAEDEATA